MIYYFRALMDTPSQVIETARLKLRKITNDDIENIYRGLSDPEVIRYYGVSYSSLEETREQMEWYQSLEDQGTGLWWAITHKYSGEFYGAAGLNGIIKEHKKGEIGFWLYPDCWGRGFVSEILPKVIEHGFNVLGLHRIEGIVETGNEASTRVLEKLGFKKEGVMQDSEIKEGRFISLEVYALLNRDLSKSD